MLRPCMIWLFVAGSLSACTTTDAPRKQLKDVDFTALTTPCDCLEAATVMYDHSSELVLKIKGLSDQTRKHNNLGEPTPDAVLDSLLMLSEQLRADLDGPGRDLHAACKELVAFNAVGEGAEEVDCDNLERFRAAHVRLDGLKKGAQR